MHVFHKFVVCAYVSIYLFLYKTIVLDPKPIELAMGRSGSNQDRTGVCCKRLGRPVARGKRPIKFG
jgi:hypothetical protein